MVRYTPQEILVETLTNRLTDPRGRLSEKTNTLTATEGQAEFTMSPSTNNKAYSVSSVTVEGTAQTKWADYYIDLQNSKIILKTGATAEDTVIIVFKEGTSSWIFSDKSRLPLTLSSYPRISLFVVDGHGERVGNYQAPVEHNIRFQIDIWTKEDLGDESQLFTINGRVYEGDKLSNILGALVCEVLEDYENDMYPFLYEYTPITCPRDMPMEGEQQAFHTVVECSLKTISIGGNV